MEFYNLNIVCLVLLLAVLSLNCNGKYAQYIQLIQYPCCLFLIFGIYFIICLLQVL